MIRFKYNYVAIVMVFFVIAGNCFSAYLSWDEPLIGIWNDANNWAGGMIPSVALEGHSGDSACVGTWYDAGNSFGHAIIDKETWAYTLTIGSHIQGYGIVDVPEGVTFHVSCLLGADDTADSLGYMNVWGNVDCNIPGEWSRLSRGGRFYWNQYSGKTYIPTMNYWAEAISSILYINVSGGIFEAGYKTIPMRGKVYINVSQTGKVKIEDWRFDGTYPRSTGATYFTVSGAGKLIVRNDQVDPEKWVNDPTLGGLVASKSTLVATHSVEYPDYTEISTNACGAIDPADFNMDCKINFKDFALLAENWLD
jgi:hypothetical protein